MLRKFIHKYRLYKQKKLSLSFFSVLNFIIFNEKRCLENTILLSSTLNNYLKFGHVQQTSIVVAIYFYFFKQITDHLRFPLILLRSLQALFNL